MADDFSGTAFADPQREIHPMPDFPAEADALPIPELTLQIRVWQRTAWESNKPVTVEEILARFPKIREDSESLFDLIYHEYLLRERFGEDPRLEDFVSRFPQHGAVLRMQIALHCAMQSAPPDAEGPRQTDALGLNPALPPRDAALFATAIPGYDVLNEIGFGGMGVVYRARHAETGRIVAIKVLSAGIHAGPNQQARLRAEAELIGRLQHSNIVQIHKAGESHGCPFVVLEFVGGGTLRDRLHGAPHAPRAAARLVEVIARAVAAAHTAGVVHRDLKPGNILFAEAGEPASRVHGIESGTPKIADFGLAKSFGVETTSGSGHGTMTGDILGTPAYMSPEQAAGQTSAVGPATDTYALGAILYELLTGRPPFRGVTAVETLQLVVAAEVVAPSRLQPGVPANLETICLKCLEKQPVQRYASAAHLADDLGHYLAGEPILARPVGPLVKLARWCRRKPLLAGLVSLVAMLLLVIAGGSVAAALRLNQAARDRYAEAKLAEARFYGISSQLDRGEKSLAALAEAARVRATPEIRDEAIASLARFDLKLDPYTPSASGLIDFSPNLTCYAQQAATGEVVVRRVRSDAEICRIKHEQVIIAAAFSPDGKYLVCRWPNDARLEVWFVGNNEPRLVVSDKGDATWGIGAVAFSSDSRQVACGHPDGLVRIFQLENGARLAEFQVAPRIRHLAFHPLRPQLAVATDANLQVRSTQEGRLLIQLDDAAGCGFLSWHPRGNYLVATNPDFSLSLWEPDSLRRRQTLPGHASGGVTTAFNHSGTLLFSTAWDGSLRVWDPHWGKPLFATIGSQGYYLRFSDDDRFWAGDVLDGRVRIWEFSETPGYRRLTPAGVFDLGYCQSLAVSPAGSGCSRLLAVAMENGVGLWDLRTGRPVGHLPIGKTMDLAYDETGNLLTADTRGVQVWPIRESPEATSGLQIGPPERLACPGTLSQLACSADGQVVGLSRLRSGGLIFHRDRADSLVSLSPHDGVRSIKLAPDGKLAATACQNGRLVRIWNANNGTLVHDLEMGSSRVAFSPDGRKLLTTGNGLELWSVDDWGLIWKGAGDHLSAHAFSPDGKLVALDTGTGQVLLYAADDGRVLARLDDPYPTALHVLTFAPDGRSLVGISRDLFQMFVWDLDSVARNLERIGLDSSMAIAVRRGAPDSPAALTLDIRLSDPESRTLDDLARCKVELTSQPGNAALLFRLGLLLAELGRDRESRVALVGAVGDSAAFLPSVELAACEIRLGNWKEGLAVFERALASPDLHPAQQAGLCNQTAWYLNLAPPENRDPQKAVDYACRALQLDTEGFRFLNILGMALYRRREFPLAIETLRLSLRTSAQPAFDLYMLALCHQMTGDHRRAADFASRADYLFETHGKTWNSQRRGEFQRLREEYVLAIKPAHD